MKKIIRLTESDLVRIVKRVIKEDDEDLKRFNELTSQGLDGLEALYLVQIQKRGWRDFLFLNSSSDKLSYEAADALYTLFDNDPKSFYWFTEGYGNQKMKKFYPPFNGSWHEGDVILQGAWGEGAAYIRNKEEYEASEPEKIHDLRAIRDNIRQKEDDKLAELEAYARRHQKISGCLDKFIDFDIHVNNPPECYRKKMDGTFDFDTEGCIEYVGNLIGGPGSKKYEEFKQCLDNIDN